MTIDVAHAPSPPEAAAPPLAERVRAALADRYDVTDELGRGRRDVVFLGADLGAHRPVAIRVLRPELASDAAQVERWLAAARVQASLGGTGIVPVLDVRTTDGLACCVMPLVLGASLGALHDLGEQWPVDQVRWLLMRAGDALVRLHAAGVVHGALVANTLLVDGRGDVLLGDVGEARTLDEIVAGDPHDPAGDDAHQGRDGDRDADPRSLDAWDDVVVLGHAHVPPPSAEERHAVALAEDQAALGRIAFTLLAGRAPTSGDLVPGGAGAALRRVRPECPPPLAAAVMRMLAPDVEDRWPSLAMVRETVRGTLPRDGGAAREALAQRARAHHQRRTAAAVQAQAASRAAALRDALRTSGTLDAPPPALRGDDDGAPRLRLVADGDGRPLMIPLGDDAPATPARTAAFVAAASSRLRGARLPSIRWPSVRLPAVTLPTFRVPAMRVPPLARARTGALVAAGAVAVLAGGAWWLGTRDAAVATARPRTAGRDAARVTEVPADARVAAAPASAAPAAVTPRAVTTRVADADAAARADSLLAARTEALRADSAAARNREAVAAREREDQRLLAEARAREALRTREGARLREEARLRADAERTRLADLRRRDEARAREDARVRADARARDEARARAVAQAQQAQAARTRDAGTRRPAPAPAPAPVVTGEVARALSIPIPDVADAVRTPAAREPEPRATAAPTPAPPPRPIPPPAPAVLLPNGGELRAEAERIAAPGRLATQYRDFFVDGDDHAASIARAPTVINTVGGRVRADFEVRLAKFDAAGRRVARVATVTMEVARDGQGTRATSITFGPLRRP